MERFAVYSLRESNGFTQEDLEQAFSTLEEAKECADELFDGLARYDQKIARYEVRSTDSDLEYFINFEIYELRNEIDRLESDIEIGNESLDDWAEWLNDHKNKLAKLST